MNRIFAFIAIFLTLCFSMNCSAQLEGDWFLIVEQGVERSGVLTLESQNGIIIGFVDGGPIPLSINDDRIEMDIDYRDGGGRLLSRHLTGVIQNNVMEGNLIAPMDGSTGAWSASRIIPQSGSIPGPRPADLSGIWSRISDGMEKVHLDYTDATKTKVDAYSYLDDPALRCVSPGLVRVSGWPYPLEILQGDDRITILYESFHEVRRIFLDGRDFPKELPATAMGYSIGHWQGSTLVVETRLLKPGYADLSGQPVSENTRVVEKMSVSVDGQILRSELTLYDPENYKRPITRFRSWSKTPDTVILEYDCDPYAFFRGLELEGKLDDYWHRMRMKQ